MCGQPIWPVWAPRLLQSKRKCHEHLRAVSRRRAQSLAPGAEPALCKEGQGQVPGAVRPDILPGGQLLLHRTSVSAHTALLSESAGTLLHLSSDPAAMLMAPGAAGRHFPTHTQDDWRCRRPCPPVVGAALAQPTSHVHVPGPSVPVLSDVRLTPAHVTGTSPHHMWFSVTFPGGWQQVRACLWVFWVPCSLKCLVIMCLRFSCWCHSTLCPGHQFLSAMCYKYFPNF